MRVTNLDDGGNAHDMDRHDTGRDRQSGGTAGTFAELPLYDTAEVVGRRLADHLRELGFAATIIDDAAGPLTGPGKETWRGMRDDVGYLAAYAHPGRRALPERSAEVWSQSGGNLDGAGVHRHIGTPDRGGRVRVPDGEPHDGCPLPVCRHSGCNARC